MPVRARQRLSCWLTVIGAISAVILSPFGISPGHEGFLRLRHVAYVMLCARLRSQKRSDKGIDAGHVRDIASGASYTPLKITRPPRSSKPRRAIWETPQSGLEITGGYSRGCYLPVDHALRSAPGADVQARRRRECRRRLSWPPEAGSRSRHSCPCRQVLNGPGIPITACCQKRTAPKRRWASPVRQDYPVCSPSLTRAEEATAVQNGSTCGLSPSSGRAR
jgi:hypothetical protein